MAHARIDDLYDDKRKIKRAWRAHPPNPIALHVMAITYCQRHRLDGRVPDDWIEELVPNAKQRARIVQTMVDERLFDNEPHDDGTYRVHNFLKWNESAAERNARAEKARKAAYARHGNANGNA